MNQKLLDCQQCCNENDGVNLLDTCLWGDSDMQNKQEVGNCYTDQTPVVKSKSTSDNKDAKFMLRSMLTQFRSEVLEHSIYSLRPKISVLSLVQICTRASTKLRHLFWD